MQEKGFIELSYLYDYYDTVYEWSELPHTAFQQEINIRRCLVY